MSPFAAVAVKTVGAVGVAALVGLGAMTASAATTSTTIPSPNSSSSRASSDRHVMRQATIEAEADVLGITPAQLVADLKAGQKVSDLAKDKGMTKEQFETRLVASLKPRLEALVDKKVITQAQVDKVLDRISKGHIPFWDGIHHHNNRVKK